VANQTIGIRVKLNEWQIERGEALYPTVIEEAEKYI